MKVRLISLIAAVAVGLVLVGPSSPARGNGYSVKIGKHATFYPVPAFENRAILVPLQVRCPAGEALIIVVGVSQVPPTSMTSGFGGSLSHVCTGHKQSFDMFVVSRTSAFAPGRAFAGAAITFPDNADASDQRLITISSGGHHDDEAEEDDD